MTWEEFGPFIAVSDGDGNTVADIEVVDRDVVPMGDGYAYRQIRYTDTASGGTFLFEVRGGIPGCIRVELSGDERFIRTKDLTAIKLDDIRIETYALTGVTRRPDGSFVHRIDYNRDRKRVQRIKKRSKVTDDRIRRAAEVYNGTAESDRAEVVGAALNVAPRQAWRYIAQARERGLIT
jgi:hypothetical protein